MKIEYRESLLFRISSVSTLDRGHYVYLAMTGVNLKFLVRVNHVYGIHYGPNYRNACELHVHVAVTMVLQMNSSVSLTEHTVSS